MKYTKEELLLIWLDSFSGLNSKLKAELYVKALGEKSIKDFLIKNRETIVGEADENVFSTLVSSANDVYLKYMLDGYERKGIKAITVQSKGYPESLKNLPFPPTVIYAKGNENLLTGKLFSIVGARKSLPLSISVAKSYAKALVNVGYTLVTGIAEGVDSAVIEEALNNNGKVISVLAGGHDNVYPASHSSLVDKISDSGLVISEYPPEVKAMPYFFPVRNRIIAGLSRGTLVVSAGKKSGTMHTAHYAEEYGKDLFAVPYSVGVASGAGCNELIKMGAMLTDTPDDILSFYGEERKEKINLTPNEKEICILLLDGERHIEYICEKLGKQIYEISPIISILEIKGVLSKMGSNVYGLMNTDLED